MCPGLARSRLHSDSREVRQVGEPPAFQELQESHQIGFREDPLEWLGWKPWEQGVARRHRVPMLCDGQGPLGIVLVAEACEVPESREPLDFLDSLAQIVAMPPVGGHALPVETGGAEVIQWQADPSL